MVYIQYDNLIQFYTMHRGYSEDAPNRLRSVSSGRKIFHKNRWVLKDPAEAGPTLLGI